MTKESERRAPVQGFSAGIPWDMHLRAYDEYCKRWGPQEALIDLEGRNCRGGFHTGELDEFIPGWREELGELERLRAKVERLERRLAEMEPRTAVCSNCKCNVWWEESCVCCGALYLPESVEEGP